MSSRGVHYVPPTSSQVQQKANVANTTNAQRKLRPPQVLAPLPILDYQAAPTEDHSAAPTEDHSEILTKIDELTDKINAIDAKIDRIQPSSMGGRRRKSSKRKSAKKSMSTRRRR